MRVKRWLSAGALLLGSIVLLNSSTLLAQAKSQYRKGRLLKTADAPDVLETTHKASRLLLIQDGSDEYVAHYTVSYFGRVNKNLAPGSDVEFRISGKHLFLKTSDGKEIKARLCDRDGNAVLCGSVTFAPAFPPDPTAP